MDYHQNARLTVVSREQMCREVVLEGLTLKLAAASFNVSQKTAVKWVRRYREAGVAGLCDRSSRPRRLRAPTSNELVARVEALRRERWTGHRIARQTGLSRATVCRILRRLKLNRIRDLEPPPVVPRYEHEAPGDLLHLDIKRLVRIARPSHRVTSNRRDKVPGIGALRLPALAGFLLFQLCLYFFVRRLAGDRAAIIAAAVPLLTPSFRYSAEGRPYGLLLGLYALSLLCWQIATQNDGISRSRLLPLIGLTLSIALAITSHYFGILILIPVSLGEFSRIYIRKRLDLGVLAALILGLASVGLILPFKRALMVYRQHYYIKGVNIHDISMSYRELFVLYTTWPMPLQRLAAALMVGLVLTLAYANCRRFKRRPATEYAYTWVALSAMALLPFFGYFLGRFVTHTFEHRYVIATLIAFAAAFAIALERPLRSNTFYYLTVAIIAIAAIAINAWNIAKERRGTNEVLASFQLSPEASTALHQNPHEHIYLQSLFEFYFNTYYDPDPTLRPRFSLLYGQQQEIYWLQHDTNYITAVNLGTFAPLSVTSYNDFRQQPHPLLILNHTSWEWIDKQLAADHTPQIPLGNALRGQLARVTNTPTQKK